MIYLFSALMILGVIAVTIIYFCKSGNRQDQQDVKSKAIVNNPEPVVDPDCCGQHEVCERDSLIAAVSKKIEYYDDEELDIYRGTDSGEYDEKAVDEFREVFYTMPETDVAGWLRSLQLRNINLPDQLKDEALLIIEERRNNKSGAFE